MDPSAGAVLAALAALSAPQLFRDQARSLLLVQPRDFVIHGTFHALIVSGFREELFYRAFAGGLLARALPGGWGTVLSVALFSTAHFFNDGPLPVRLIWVLTTLPAAVSLELAYQSTGRVYAPWLAHAASNALAMALTATVLFAPALRIPVSAAVLAVAVWWLIRSRSVALHLLGSARRLAVGFGRHWRAGLLLLGLLLSGQWAVAQIPWGDLPRAAALTALLLPAFVMTCRVTPGRSAAIAAEGR